MERCATAVTQSLVVPTSALGKPHTPGGLPNARARTDRWVVTPCNEHPKEGTRCHTRCMFAYKTRTRSWPSRWRPPPVSSRRMRRCRSLGGRPCWRSARTGRYCMLGIAGSPRFRASGSTPPPAGSRPRGRSRRPTRPRFWPPTARADICCPPIIKADMRPSIRSARTAR